MSRSSQLLSPPEEEKPGTSNVLELIGLRQVLGVRLRRPPQLAIVLDRR